MSLITMRLSLQVFPQTWNDGSFSFNLIVLPVGDPVSWPLFGGMTPPFVGKPIPLVATIAAGPGAPTPSLSGQQYRFTATPPAGAATVFAALAAKFPIAPSPPPSGPTQPQRRIFKLLPQSYLDVAPSGARSKYALDPDQFACEVTGQRPQPSKNPPPPGTSWGAVFGYALRRPALGAALGIRYEARLNGVDPSALGEGGWLFVTLDPDASADPWVAAWLLDATTVRSYAAWLPPSPKGRLFSPVLFAVVPPGEIGAPETVDEARIETAEYADGFAKIVHTSQAATIDPSTATSTLMPPGSDIGVQIGWDDEQVLAWHNRQLDMADRAGSDPTAGEVALGVMGYRIDARIAGGGHPWISLTDADVDQSALAAILGNGPPTPDVEPIYESVSTSTSGATRLMPTYFAQWRGRAITARDDSLRQITGTANAADPGTVTQAAPKLLLLYGRSYELRVRLADLSGGGPRESDEPSDPENIVTPLQEFRRHVPPKTVRLTLDPPATALPNLTYPPAPTVLPTFDRKPPTVTRAKIRRPKLGYPEVLFTPHYAGTPTDFQNSLASVIASGPQARSEGQAAGLPDPDADELEIWIEVRAPRHEVPGPGLLDGEFRIAFKAPPFPLPRLVPGDPQSDPEFMLNFNYASVASIFDYDPQLARAPDGSSASLTLPAARDVRLRLRTNGAKSNYFAGDTFSNGLWRDVFARDEETNAAAFLADVPGAPPVIAFLFNRPAGSDGLAPSPTAQLADSLGLVADGLTLKARPGERVVFAASHNVRHLLRGDAGAITFSAASDLLGHWIVALTQEIDRDWTWDGLAPPPIPDPEAQAADAAIAVNRGGAWIGTMRIPRVLGPEALTPPDPADSQAAEYRRRTRLVFIDAVDPNGSTFEPPHAGETEPAPLVRHWEFVALATLQGGATQTEKRSFDITLPIATPPKAIPALATAGLALSAYAPSPDYASTNPRDRSLWIELSEPAPDNQALFARILAEAPDPLLHRNAAVASVTPPDPPPINLDPEFIRRILPLPTGEDGAGLDAMTRLDDMTSDRRFVRIPLPPQVSADDPRLFGFWGYEFRFGHTQWSTAQARFGRPLAVSGVQHPSPPLRLFAGRTYARPYFHAPLVGASNIPITDNLARTAAQRLAMAGAAEPSSTSLVGLGAIEAHLTPTSVRLSAPYARAVWRGRFLVLAEDEPTTTIVFFIYGRVKRADDGAYRNILLMHRVADLEWKGAPFGFAVFADIVLRRRLLSLGLPQSAPLGAVAVEFLPGGNWTIPRPSDFLGIASQQATAAPPRVDPAGPTSFASRRILRVSPLTPIPVSC